MLVGAAHSLSKAREGGSTLKTSHAILWLSHAGDADHADGLDWAVLVVREHLADLANRVPALHNSAEHGVLGGTQIMAPPIQMVVVHSVDEELGPTAVGVPLVGHRKGARHVGDVRLELIGNAALLVTRHRIAVGHFERGGGRGAPGPCPRVAVVPRVGAPELNHEVVDDPVEMDPVVEPGLRQVHEVGGREGHGIQEQFDHKVSLGGMAFVPRVPHPLHLLEHRGVPILRRGGFSADKHECSHRQDRDQGDHESRRAQSSSRGFHLFIFGP
mmetsp:Transcript_34930/g.58458  ORF Transcript_34930/g.58458 Transcript_34930/m.58458 type:complete len:272 (-) Transcript_34930:69-884(-)